MKFKIKMKGHSREELLKQLDEFFNGADTDQEVNKRINELENKYTPKREILQKSKKSFYDVLDAYIQGTLSNEKALLLLQSKYQQLGEEIKDMAENNDFIEIDYEDSNGYIPEEFMKIVNDVNYYYNITKNNIGENTDINLKSFSSPAVKRVVNSVSATFDKYFGTTEKKESQPKQGTTTSSQNSESPAAEPNTAINLPLNEILEKTMKIEEEIPPRLETLEMLTKGDSPILRIWIRGKYKCSSLESFVKAYIKIADNLTPSLIRDYLISERTDNPYTNNSIEKALTLYGPGRK